MQLVAHAFGADPLVEQGQAAARDLARGVERERCAVTVAAGTFGWHETQVTGDAVRRVGPVRATMSVDSLMVEHPRAQLALADRQARRGQLGRRITHGQQIWCLAEILIGSRLGLQHAHLLLRRHLLLGLFLERVASMMSVSGSASACRIVSGVM